jgi:hypothetical protein
VQVFRSYGGEWDRLCDLVRASLVFDDVEAMAKCLRLISGDHEIRYELEHVVNDEIGYVHA